MHVTSSSRASSVRAGQSYTIHSGDTLWAIASRLKAQGVQGSHWDIIRMIQRLNPSITNPNLIISGRSLRLPGPGAVADGFSPAQSRPRGATGWQSPTQQAPVSQTVQVPPGSSRADAIRAQVAQWAVQQANDPNIGYSQTKGRFGNATDSQGNRYFDCSGLVYTAYKQFGITLGGNWTGAMRSTWRNWADQVPKNPGVMKPGDLILMDGHVVMYIGNGRCVGAQTSHTNFQDQVTTNIDVNRYLARPDAIVLRPRV